MGVLHLFVWNYVKYANMEGFRRDSHIYLLDFAWTDQKVQQFYKAIISILIVSRHRLHQF